MTFNTRGFTAIGIVATPTLDVLYDLADKKGSQEHDSETFWSHCFGKQNFFDEEWVMAHQKPPSEAKESWLRRVDFNVCIVNPLTRRLRITSINEVKGAHTTEKDLGIVEAQAQQASEAGGSGPVWAQEMPAWVTVPLWAIVAIGLSSTPCRAAFCEASASGYRTWRVIVAKRKGIIARLLF